MKKVRKSLMIILALFATFNVQISALQAQTAYWIMLTDKAGTTFDPYSYFDSKAIERYRLNNADLYDITNYPLNDSYVQQIDALATEDFGQSRWLNAVAVIATPDQVEAIRQLPFVSDVVALESNMQLAYAEDSEPCDMTGFFMEGNPADQLIRMGRDDFRKAGINGKGIRIAVFDGGFPQVDTHIAFKHLRDEGRILKTWNFPKKKENVYGWNSHGTMTLSCIAGIRYFEDEKGTQSEDIGMATGAEFLLARTEVGPEPFKEEVWWQMAVEWADKNGAQIISSSLGYGKDRYYTKDMNGQSYVAKAGNLAARKGILVCNSAGNEGDDKSWRTIITPADADSVLCVGGIANSLTEYTHIAFSSYGPSADGRQKPNVVAFGHAYTANTGSSNKEFHYVDGTSFSCPLVAGFAACALQAQPKLTAMQLFHEIEKSADLYPYCDYSYGYGVPQADYFTGSRKAVEPTFKFQKTDKGVQVVFLRNVKNSYMYLKNSKADGTITAYSQKKIESVNKNSHFLITEGDIVTINIGGYTQSYTVNNHSSVSSTDGITIESDDDSLYVSPFYTIPSTNKPIEKKLAKESYYMLGLPINIQTEELDHNFWSPTLRIGFRSVFNITKSYGWGLAFEYGHSSFRFGNEANRLDSLAAMDDNVRWLDKKVKKHKLNLGEVGIELFQRVRIIPLGLTHKGLHWDLGIYGNWAHNAYKLAGSHDGDIATTRKEVVRNLDLLDSYRWNWGVTTRLTYDVIGLYARLRLNDIGKEVPAGQFILPQLEVGLHLAF